jgi:hypothetical protein
MLIAVAPMINVTMPGYPDGALVGNPFAVAPDAALWSVVLIEPIFFIGLATNVVAAISLILRARRSSGLERQQLRWVAASVGALVAAAIGGVIASAVVPAGIAYLASIVAFAALPLSIGVAVLRYRLYEIDRIVSRTLGWLLLTVILGAVFAAFIVGLQALLAPYTERNTLAVAGSTLAAFALFQPLRRRVQLAVDTRFNRARVDADRARDAFGHRLREDVDLDAVRGRLVETARETLRPAGVDVWLRSDAGSR